MASALDPAITPQYLAQDSSNRLFAANTTMLVITTILLSLRLWARNLTNAQRSWDDYLLPPAWLLLIGLIVIDYLMLSQAGVGRHIQVVVAEDPQKLTNWFKFLYILDWFYVPSNMLSRLSVVSLYLRIFNSKRALLFAWIIFGFLIANCVATVIAAQLECIPLEFTWNKNIEGGRCFNQILWYKLTNIPNIVADVAILILPTPTIWTLKASTARRAGIALVCLTGSVGLIASCIRTSAFFTADFNDPTYSSASLLCWTVVECGMYFSAACLIGLRPLFARLPKALRSRLTGNYSGRSESRRVPLVSLRRFKRPAQNTDLDSFSQIVRGDTEFDPKEELGEGHGTIRGTDNGDIRVERSFQVNSEVFPSTEKVNGVSADHYTFGR